MKVICAWCGKDMGEKDGKGVEGVSHGICEDCVNKYFPEITIPEPRAFKVRAELRKQPTRKLQEAYEALKGGQTTPGTEDQASAIREILWERGKWHPAFN